jgi:hypothetical protein
MIEHTFFAIAALAVLYTIIERFFVTSSVFFPYYLALSLFIVGVLLF